MLNPNLLFSRFDSQIAVVENGMSFTYVQLLENINKFQKQLDAEFSAPMPVLLYGDFSFSSISWLFALLAKHYVVLLQSPGTPIDDLLIRKAGIVARINTFDNTVENFIINEQSSSVQHLMLKKEGGLLLMSSGTAGNPKLILHSANRLLNKFSHSRKAYRTLCFLLFDHIAGFDTMMYTLHAGGTMIVLPNRNVHTVLQCMQQNEVEVMPTTPSFINLLLFESNFSSQYLPYLKIITFGSERINQSTLNRLKNRFGSSIRIEQKYGLTELGSLVLKSKPNDPTWIQLDKRFADWKVVDEQLYIKTTSSLEAYIFPDREEECHGWFNTQDLVSVDGDWIQILGRKTDIINVGGQKVYPSEVESILQQMEGVLQVVVTGTPHPLMGQVVKATIQTVNEVNEKEFRSALRLYCKDKLEKFKIPVIVDLTTANVLSDRFKASRK